MATYQSIAAQVSAPKPLDGENSRSSQNFEFLAVPATGNITVSMPAGIDGALRRDVTGSDPLVHTISDGYSFAASDVETGDDYYIASPSGASLNYIVTFSGSV